MTMSDSTPNEKAEARRRPAAAWLCDLRDEWEREYDRLKATRQREGGSYTEGRMDQLDLCISALTEAMQGT